MSSERRTSQAWFAAALGALGLALLQATIPGLFVVDDANHLASVVALRHGRLSLPGLEGLPASRELAFFNPSPKASATVSTVPPLYAVFALPFSLLGVRGLIALNTLAFLATAALVFAYARRFASRPQTPWVAAGAFALASYGIEYALGVWSHMLAVALCTGGVVAASRARETDRPSLAAAAGLLVGLAAGVRYQEIAIAALLGATLLLWAPRRLRFAVAYAGGLALPLAASSVLNFFRSGSWNPISKGQGYLTAGAGHVIANPFVETLVAFWTFVVDFTAHPVQSFPDLTLTPDPASGAFVLLGAVKKAWVQSLPWVPVVLVGVVLAWRARTDAGSREGAVRRELRALSIVVWPMLGLFSVAGFSRFFDGLCFNQRYFLELVPLAAVALAWIVERYTLRIQPFLLGIVAGSLAAVNVLHSPVRLTGLVKAPLVLAALFLLAWAVAARWHRTGPFALTLGACLAWALTVHVGDDLPASRRLRVPTGDLTRILSGAFPDGSAVFTWGASTRNAVAALQLERDFVLVEAGRDDGEDAVLLLEAFLRRRQPVFVVAHTFPPPVLRLMMSGRAARTGTVSGQVVVELREATGDAAKP